MYYDRSLDPVFLKLFERGESFGWLVDEVLDAEWATSSHAHLQFRRAKGTRKAGGFQIYFGRTSPLEICASARHGVRLKADEAYQGVTEWLFGKVFDSGQMVALSPAIRSHLEACARKLRGSTFLSREAIVHAGLMRQYGPQGRPENDFRALDSEVRVGYDSKDARSQFFDSLRRTLDLSTSAALPSKLDAIGVLRDGALALVEVKDRAGDLRRAAVQAAAHIAIFEELVRRNPSLPHSLERLIDQKHGLGLLGPVPRPTLTRPLRFVPVIAAPDDCSNWCERWKRSLESVPVPMAMLGDLRLWRLDDHGGIAEERRP